MGWPLVLGVLVAGLLLGQVWARRSRRLWGKGSARPGLALGCIAAVVAALVVGLRGLWPEALGLLALALVLAVVGRGRILAAESKTGGAGAGPRMSASEAAALLGVEPDAEPEAIKAAHRRLIRMGHPDQGGTAGLAAQLNAARDVLLSRRGADG